MTSLTNSLDIKVAQAMARRSALRLEISGLRRRGRSAYSICKSEYGLTGNRESVLTQMGEVIEKIKGGYHYG